MAYLLHELALDAASRHPKGVAVRCRQQSLTYEELSEESLSLARLLVDSGVERGDRVGICLPKSLEAITSIYATLWVGAAYVPLELNSPPKRLAWIIRDCRVRAVLTTAGIAAKLLEELTQPPLPEVVIVVPDEPSQATSAPPLQGEVHCVPWSERSRFSRRRFRPPHQTEEDLAYILYTSGSTGSPKGVMISHRAALTFVDWVAQEVRLTSEDRVSNHAPFQFDLSVFDLFATAHAGGTVVLVPEELSAFPLELSKLWEDEQISVWYSVPSILSRLASHGELSSRDLGALRTVIFAGEVFPVEHFKRLASLLPKVEFYNFYGPTETNVCTYRRVDPESVDQAIPIGQACPNVDVWAVSEDGKLAGPGESGELWVTGPSLMKGYWGLPEKTRQVFTRVPAPGGWGRLQAYRTGDLVEVAANGEYVFRGRLDSMVKLRGYRIELGEVEAVLYQNPSVLEAAAIALGEGTSEAELAAVVTLQDGASGSSEQLRRWLLERLPPYMVPSHLEIRPSLPRTTTGKVDKRLLQRELRESE